MLAAEIEAARQRELVAAFDAGEKAVAQAHPDLFVAPELEPRDLELLKPWLAYCQEKIVRNVPAKTWCVAAFVLERHERGIPESKIFAELAAIGKLHDRWRLARPFESAIVNAAIERITKAQPPRSWPPEDKALWASLPVQIRFRIAEREEQRDRELRRMQNEHAELKKQLKPDAPKEAVTTEKEKV
jgi:hypothetical protein